MNLATAIVSGKKNNALPPVAYPQSVGTTIDTPLPITLTGTDPGGLTPLTYSIFSVATNGSVSGSGSERLYTPDEGFTGEDSFQYRVRNTALIYSPPETITITVS